MFSTIVPPERASLQFVPLPIQDMAGTAESVKHRIEADTVDELAGVADILRNM